MIYQLPTEENRRAVADALYRLFVAAEERVELGRVGLNRAPNVVWKYRSGVLRLSKGPNATRIKNSLLVLPGLETDAAPEFATTFETLWVAGPNERGFPWWKDSNESYCRQKCYDFLGAAFLDAIARKFGRLTPRDVESPWEVAAATLAEENFRAVAFC